MTPYMADSIFRLASEAREEPAFDDAVPVFSVRTNTVRGLDAAKDDGGPTARGIDRCTALSAQATEGFFQKIVKALHAERHVWLIEDPDWVLCRRAAFDGAPEVVVPASVREQVSHLSHEATLARHPGESRRYAAMRRYYYWVGMAADVVSYVRTCDSWARLRVRPVARRSPLTLFSDTMPLHGIPVDLQGRLDRTAAGHRLILVITDRFTKLVRDIPMDGTSAVNCA